MPAIANEDVRLPDGPIVRIRMADALDGDAAGHLLAARDAVRTGPPAAAPDAVRTGPPAAVPALVADLPWGGAIVGHATWRRLHGSGAGVAITVARGFARWPVAAHLLVRLAHLADASLVPTLVVGERSGDLARLAETGFGGRRTGAGVEIATAEWPAALATLEHRSAAFAPVAATAPAAPSPPPGPVVIAGGGVAALECLMALRDVGDPALRVRLVAPGDAFVLRPLQVVEPFSDDAALRWPLSRIAAEFDAELVTDAVAAVQPGQRRAIGASGEALDYGTLVLAPGVRSAPAFQDAITFGLDPGHRALRGLLADLAAGRVTRVAFLVPPETTWSLPLYELALMTARAAGRDAKLSIVTPEQRPLAIFGPPVSASVERLLATAGVEFVGGVYATAHEGSIGVEPGGRVIAVDRAVALPALRGPAIAGVPADAKGFIRTDAFGAVPGADGVFAAGDATTFPVKQGGLAAQQADTVAEAVAARHGAPLVPRPFRPVLRGRLFTGAGDRFLRAGIGGGEGDGTADLEPLWWPPGKVAGLYLAPYLHANAGVEARAPGAGFSEIRVELGQPA